MKEKIFISLMVVITFGFGMIMGYIVTNRYKSEPRIEIKEVIKEVSPCDKSFSEAEKQMCIAKDACNGKLKDFKYNSLKVETIFNCKE